MTPEEQNKLLKQDSKTLAVTIIAYRVLGLYKEEAKKCMMVLMQRKLKGDEFEFERFIEDGVNEYKINVNTDLLSDLKKQVSHSLAKDIVNCVK
jgi:hypothetical protein